MVHAWKFEWMLKGRIRYPWLDAARVDKGILVIVALGDVSRAWSCSEFARLVPTRHLHHVFVSRVRSQMINAHDGSEVGLVG